MTVYRFVSITRALHIVCPLGTFGYFDVRMTSDYDIGFWSDYGVGLWCWIVVGFAKTAQRLFKVEILTPGFQHWINIRFSTWMDLG